MGDIIELNHNMELKGMVAHHVMGWKCHKGFYSDGEGLRLSVSLWNPDNDANDTLRMLKEGCGNCFSYDIMYDGQYVISVVLNDQEISCYSHSSLPVSACLAMLEAKTGDTYKLKE